MLETPCDISSKVLCNQPVCKVRASANQGPGLTSDPVGLTHPAVGVSGPERMRKGFSLMILLSEHLYSDEADQSLWKSVT